jgi:hypothetical protein
VPAGSDFIDPGDDPFPDVPSSTATTTSEEDTLDHLAGDGGGEEDPKLGITWAKDRLLEAFPGAEEVESS